MYLEALDTVSEDQRDIFVERMREKGLQRLQNDGLYAFCTEDVACYLPALKAEGGRCLTVAASGDQAVNLLMAGAEEVVAFDIVREAGYLLDLKLAALAAAGDDPGEFRGRFLDRLSPEGFKPIKKSLASGTRDFVQDMAMLTTDFGHVAFRPFLITGRNAYIVDEGSFARAKAAVVRAREDDRVSFLCADLRTVPFAPGIGTFDAICLSAIQISVWKSVSAVPPSRDHRHRGKPLLRRLCVTAVAVVARWEARLPSWLRPARALPGLRSPPPTGPVPGPTAHAPHAPLSTCRASCPSTTIHASWPRGARSASVPARGG